ncbi:unnamed protein product [Closterium sp. Naga37s-1]|nr:unnamed protein product [Closterium sp. Naga37s-1]
MGPAPHRQGSCPPCRSSGLQSQQQIQPPQTPAGAPPAAAAEVPAPAALDPSAPPAATPCGCAFDAGPAPLAPDPTGLLARGLFAAAPLPSLRLPFPQLFTPPGRGSIVPPKLIEDAP